MPPRDTIASRLVTVAEAFSLVPSHSLVVVSMAAAEPRLFFENLAVFSKDKENITVHCANPSQEYPCFTDEHLGHSLRMLVMFLTEPVRKHQGRDLIHYVPQHLSQWARTFKDQGVDIFWGSCAPPDKRGFISLGTGSCYEPEVLRFAKKVILEINPQVPQTNGATQVPLAWIDHFIEADYPLPVVAPSPFTPEDAIIGEHVASLIHDGSTIQLGIGAIPNAIGASLRQKKNLGVHSELINDCMMRLYLQGVITGREKTIWPGKMIGSFLYGTKELYEFAHHNPAIELQHASVVNDPYRIGRNSKMFSINSAVEVDLTGQVCSESLGHYELSGVGGAAETHTGAQRSSQGRGVIALKSICKDREGKEHAKIVFALHPGAKVSISRNDVDTIVTEYGVAHLKGKSVCERVTSMINIAHPRHRDELRFNAHKFRYI